MKLKNTCSIITGGARGIGRCIAELIISKGGNVIIGDILDKEGQALVNLINKSEGKKRAAYIYCDVTKLEDIENLFKLAISEFGGAQILFNNAGVGEPPYPYDNFERSMLALNVNLVAVYQATLLAKQHFDSQLKLDPSKQFCIMNTGSFSGSRPCIEFPYYSFTKNSVLNFTQIISQLKWKNIRVNCIAPSFTKTDIIRREAGKIEKIMPLLKPEFVAQSMLELIEDPSANGIVKVLEIDGDFEAPKIQMTSVKSELKNYAIKNKSKL